MGLLLALALALLPPAPAAEDDALARVAAMVQRPALLRGRFVQQKHLAGFSKPLVSRGDFIVVRERGVLWHSREPFESILRLTREAIVETQDGTVTFRLAAEEEPALGTLSTVLFAVLTGDVDRLEQHFQATAEVDGSHWRLHLEPRGPALGAFLRRIELAGGAHVERVQIAEANGDRSEIELRELVTEPAQLSAEETARFE